MNNKKLDIVPRKLEYPMSRSRRNLLNSNSESVYRSIVFSNNDEEWNLKQWDRLNDIKKQVYVDKKKYFNINIYIKSGNAVRVLFHKVLYFIKSLFKD